VPFPTDPHKKGAEEEEKREEERYRTNHCFHDNCNKEPINHPIERPSSHMTMPIQLHLLYTASLGQLSASKFPLKKYIRTKYRYW
jgi:hypothetical protein